MHRQYLSLHSLISNLISIMIHKYHSASWYWSISQDSSKSGSKPTAPSHSKLQSLQKTLSIPTQVEVVQMIWYQIFKIYIYIDMVVSETITVQKRRSYRRVSSHWQSTIVNNYNSWKMKDFLTYMKAQTFRICSMLSFVSSIISISFAVTPNSLKQCKGVPYVSQGLSL